jgi:hypothetical protein
MPVTMAEAIVSHVYNLQDSVKMEENRSKYLSSRLDVQGYVRKINHGQVRLKVSETLHKVLFSVQVIKADHLELDAILQFYQMDCKTLKEFYGLRELVITKGDEGGVHHG